MKVYYLGPKGSFSFLMAKQVFPKETLVPLKSFSNIIESVETNHGSVGIIPIENSITSNVHENIDYMFEHYGLRIIKEAFLKINLNLISLQKSSLKNIKSAYSHRKALEQCSKFLDKNDITNIPIGSTSEAQQLLLDKDDETLAAIGSAFLIDDRLQILEKNIGNNKNNKTRFICISKNDLDKDELDNKTKSTFIIKIKHEVGSLAVLLKKLSETGANLTKIESRPIAGTDWEYLFWIDFVINTKDIDKAVQTISEHSLENRKVGVYNVGKVYSS